MVMDGQAGPVCKEKNAIKSTLSGFFHAIVKYNRFNFQARLLPVDKFAAYLNHAPVVILKIFSMNKV